MITRTSPSTDQTFVSQVAWMRDVAMMHRLSSEEWEEYRAWNRDERVLIQPCVVGLRAQFPQGFPKNSIEGLTSDQIIAIDNQISKVMLQESRANLQGNNDFTWQWSKDSFEKT